MASVDDVPDDLKGLARTVAPLTRSTMDPVELRLRCEFAAQLIGLAALSDESEGRQLRRKARRHLEALPISAVRQRCEQLQELAAQARLNDDDRAERELLDEAADLVQANPQLPEEWLKEIQLAEVVSSVKKSAVNRPRRFFGRKR